MSLGLQALLIGLVAFFGYMHSYMGSTMWNRPIIVSTLTGLVLGDLETGIIVGAALELAFLGAVPIGASNPPDMTSGSIIGTAFVIASGAGVGEAVALAIPVATLVLLLDNLQMMFILTWAAHIADRYAKEGKARKVEWVCRIAGIGNKVLLSLLVAVSFFLFGRECSERCIGIHSGMGNAWYGYCGRYLAGNRFCDVGTDDLDQRTGSVLVSGIPAGGLFGRFGIRCGFIWFSGCFGRLFLQRQP